LSSPNGSVGDPVLVRLKPWIHDYTLGNDRKFSLSSPNGSVGDPGLVRLNLGFPIMGKPKGQTPVGDELVMIEQMKAKHVLRLDWHYRNEAGDKQSPFSQGKTYLDVMFNIVGK
jgi:hypothetical protein